MNPWSATFEVEAKVTELRLDGIAWTFTQVNNSLIVPYLLANQTYQIEFLQGDAVLLEIKFHTPAFEVREGAYKPARPGEKMVISPQSGACNPGFLTSDHVGSLYFTIAAHCGDVGEVWGVYDENFDVVPIGEIALSGIASEDFESDIGLLKVLPEAYDLVLPTLVGDRGPSRPPRSASTGEGVCIYGQGGASYDALIANANNNDRILPDMRYRCGEIGSNQTSSYAHFRDRGIMQVVSGAGAGDSGAGYVLLDGAPVGHELGFISGSLPSPGESRALSICFALEKLWESGYELGIILGESVPEPSPYTWKAIPWDPQTVECDEAAPYLTVPYKSWQLREAEVL